jgi:hypothetical protein
MLNCAPRHCNATQFLGENLTAIAVLAGMYADDLILNVTYFT